MSEKHQEEPLTIPLWPDAGQMANLSRNSTYAAAARGEIPTIQFGKLKRVPLKKFRRMLEGETAA
jgi:hypothetical protein